MLINRLLLRNKKISSFQKITTRFLSTSALGIGFIYWTIFGIPKVLLSKQATALNLINSFGMHFLIIIAALLYYFTRNKIYMADKENNSPQTKEQNAKINFYEICWQYYLIFYYFFATMFAILSYILQFHLTTCIPVYDNIVDWRHPLVALFVCFGAPLIFTGIFFIMHLKNKYAQSLRGFLLISITASMSFTVSYGLCDNCLHLPALISWTITLTTTSTLSLATYLFYHFNRNENFEILFPPLANNTSEPVKCLDEYTNINENELSNYDRSSTIEKASSFCCYQICPGR